MPFLVTEWTHYEKEYFHSRIILLGGILAGKGALDHEVFVATERPKCEFLLGKVMPLISFDKGAETPLSR